VKLPHLNERIFVVLGDHRLTSRIEGTRGGDTVVVPPPSRDGFVVWPQLGEAVSIEWTTARGLYRGDGIVMAHQGDPPSAVLIRLDSSQIAQRRDHVRVDLVLDLELTQVAAPPVRCQTVDVSGGGMRALVPLDLVPGEHVSVKLSLPDEPEIQADAEVIRGTEGTSYAFRFIAVEPADRERLIRYVFAAHRREFAMVRR
jgi:c-di-GMP-binding flagellar brake protein YcgR